MLLPATIDEKSERVRRQSAQHADTDAPLSSCFDDWLMSTSAPALSFPIAPSLSAVASWHSPSEDDRRVCRFCKLQPEACETDRFVRRSCAVFAGMTGQ